MVVNKADILEFRKVETHLAIQKMMFRSYSSFGQPSRAWRPVPSELQSSRLMSSCIWICLQFEKIIRIQYDVPMRINLRSF